MKRNFTVMLLAVLAAGWGILPCYAQDSSELKGRITISGAWALYPMAVKWAEEFKKLYPKVEIDISAGGAGKGMADCLAKMVDIGMVSRDIYPVEINKGAWGLSVVKDAVVPAINANNPFINNILARGVTREEFKRIFVSGEVVRWGELLKNGSKDQVHVYTRSDACGAAETWAKYLGMKQEDLTGIGVYGDPGIAEAVKKDTLGIGYNNINYVYDSKARGEVSGIRVLPIDQNADGIINKNEDFYASIDTIEAAIADGRYPSPPARELYFVSNGVPDKKEVRAFLRWVLTEGQSFVPEAGYINVTKDKLEQGLAQLGKD